jgi:hypothetical protein
MMSSNKAMRHAPVLAYGASREYTTKPQNSRPLGRFKTAKVLDLTVPADLLVAADEID